LVYEPFLGSGTTLAAAEVTQWVCYGLELDPKYADVVVQRWQGLSHKKATLEGDGRTFEAVAAERGHEESSLSSLTKKPPGYKSGGWGSGGG
jgi:DNA modification methylase